MAWPGIEAETIGLFLQSSLLMAVPYLLASLGEAISERAGIYNVQLEGYMLMAAFCSYVVAFLTGNLWLGLNVGILGAVLFSILHAYLSVFLAADQIITGIATNIFAQGVTGLLFREVVGGQQAPVPALETIKIPLISQIPVIGTAFFEHNVLVYGTYCLALLCWFLLYRTNFGLRIRAVGEDPLVAETMGVRVYYTRFISILICGALAGLGGSFITIGYVHIFSDNVTAGRGFIALALVVFGQWNPVRIFIGSLIFGGIDALQIRLQALFGTYAGVPYPFLVMLPYVFTFVILFWSKRMKAAPKALCVPYKRER